MARRGMVIDLKKCIGCYACVIACKQEHFLPPGMTWNKILISQTGEYSNIKKHMYPVLCNHCKDPACMKVCPAGATKQREDGIIWIDQNKCVGCKNCMNACPYQTRSYHSKEEEYFPGQGFTEWEEMREILYPLRVGAVYKCNFCMERVDGGMKKGLKPGADREATPACVIACPAKARYFGDLDDLESEVSKLITEKEAIQLHPGHGTDPSVYYIWGIEEAPVVTKYFGISVYDTSPDLTCKRGAIEPGSNE
jgi:phenylacetyl-CoA:acceptor oxidoreductase subunit 1